MNGNNGTSFSTHKQDDKVTRLSPLRRFLLRPRGVALLVIGAALGLNVSGAFGLNMLGLHSAVTSTSLPASFQSASTTTYGLLTPTATTCSQFASGNASTLGEVDYRVKTGKINSVAPGVFFDWVPITSGGTSDVFTIKESVANPPAVPPKDTPAFFTMAPGSNVFTSPSCTGEGSDDPGVDGKRRLHGYGDGPDGWVVHHRHRVHDIVGHRRHSAAASARWHGAIHVQHLPERHVRT
jgi:hypothetical protein